MTKLQHRKRPPAGRAQTGRREHARPTRAERRARQRPQAEQPKRVFDVVVILAIGFAITIAVVAGYRLLPISDEPQSAVAPKVSKPSGKVSRQVRQDRSRLPVKPARKRKVPSAVSPGRDLVPDVDKLAGDFPARKRAFAIHLADFSSKSTARRAWQLLFKRYPAKLGGLTAEISQGRSATGEPVVHLLAGPFETEEDARKHCRDIAYPGFPCRVTTFDSNRLSVKLLN